MNLRTWQIFAVTAVAPWVTVITKTERPVQEIEI
jgi:hypothetical protein